MLVLAVSFPVLVPAQGSGAVLEEIIVTARKREESLQDTPISITAFTSADIEARGFSSINEITQATPNLVFDNGRTLNGSSSAYVFIRGIGQLDFTFNADPAVGTYVDGVYVSRSIGGIVNLLDIERVEVLRGPQGTLFGKNTTGGAVNITSKRPTDEFEGKAGIHTGSYDRIEGYASVNLPINDNIKTRASFSVRKRDGYGKRLIDDVDTGDTDAISGRGVIDWQLTNNLNLFVSVDGTRSREATLPYTPIAPIDGFAIPFAIVHNASVPFGACFAPTAGTNPACFNRQWSDGTGRFGVNSGFPSVSNLDLWGLSGTFTWEIGDLTLKSITAVRDFEFLSMFDLDLSPLVIFDDTTTQELTAISQEVQALGQSFNDRLEWMVGLYYLNEDANHSEDILPSIAGRLLAGGDTVNESIAVFAQGTFDITDKLSLTAGLRYTDETRKYTPDAGLFGPAQLGPFFLPPGARIDILPPVQEKTTASEVTPMVNISYAFTDDLNVYFSYTEGFKSGGFSQRIAQPIPVIPSYDPEFVKVYEGGIKFKGFDNRLQLNAAVFHTDFDDVQVLALVPPVVGSATANAGEADIDGFEVEMSALPMPGLLIQGGIGYLDAEYTRLAGNVTGVTLDSRFPNAPKWTTNASVAYEFALSQGHTIRPRVDWSYRSTVSNTAGTLAVSIQDGYSLLNASIAFETNDGKWSVILSGKNLSDEYYFIDRQTTPAFGTFYGIPAIGRTWGLNIERRF